MDRIEKMKAYKANQDRITAKKKEKQKTVFETYIETVKSLKPRIDKLLETANYCAECGIKIDGSEGGESFITNRINRLGFVPLSEDGLGVKYKALGIESSGDYGEDFRTDGNYVLSKRGGINEDFGEPLLRHMEQFLRTFDLFEATFYAHIDKTIGDANSNDKVWQIPITWMMTGFAVVTAPTLQEAIEKVPDNASDPLIGEYSCDSLRADVDDIEFVRQYYNNMQKDA